MAAPTDAVASEACPVCREPLEGRPGRCFRCETPLAQWWGFEDALGVIGVGAAVPAARRPARRRGEVPGWLAAAVIAGEILFFAGLGFGITRDPGRGRAAPAAVHRAAAVPRPPVATPRSARPMAGAVPAPSPAPVLRYRVQRGDSLWRIAAALTGRGHRWRELWPQHARGDGRVAAGTVLEVEVGRLEPPSP
jgi:hypothetical protein